jgi:crotonobetainyl-CoA:carnitine CoA-transferase CaiB-like acyl-CoA transferase
VVSSAPPEPGEHTVEALRDWGFDDEELRALGRDRVIR